MSTRWEEPAWREEILGWVDKALATRGITRVGEVEQPHVRPWATALRVPTTGGVVWCKAVHEPLRHEAALTALLGERAPGLVPPPLAVDAGRGWLLQHDAGATLRSTLADERDLEHWHGILGRYSGLQRDLVGDVDALLALGVPDMRCSVLASAYADLVHRIGAEERFVDAVRLVQALCDRLAAYGIPDTLQHDDLHDAQVFVGDDGRATVLDWGDACVSHPFLTLAVTLDGVIAWGVEDGEDEDGDGDPPVDTGPFQESYLAGWRAAYDGDLDEAAALARRLGWVCRAVNGHVEGDDASTLTRLRMFLDGHP